MSDIVPGVNSANSRRRKVQKFLQKPPRGTVKLVMMASQPAAGEGVLQLGEWEESECVPELADEILEKLDEHASEAGGAVQCTLTFENAAGKAIGTHLLKRQGNHVEEPLDGAEVTARILAGDAQGLVVHATAASFNLQRLYMGGLANLMGFHERAVERAEEHANDLRRQLVKKELECEALQRELLELQTAFAAMQSEDAPPPSPAQQEALSLLKQMAPLLFQRLMQGQPVAATAAS